MKKKKLRTIIKESETHIESLKEKFEDSVYYKMNHLSGGEIRPLYNTDSKQIGWWLVFDCPEEFSTTYSELQDMEMFIGDNQWMCEEGFLVIAWVHYDGKCHISFEIFLKTGYYGFRR